jgi:hypothetical protein
MYAIGYTSGSIAQQLPLKGERIALKRDFFHRQRALRCRLREI